MTLAAKCPFAIVFATVNREVHAIVVKSGGCPGGFRMAILTGSRKTGRSVVRVIGVVVIIFMTAKTSVRRVVIITIMAERTVIRNDGVGTVQLPIIIMDRESRRHPVGIGGMTGSAIRGNTNSLVIGIGRLIIVRLVAAHTGIRRVIVIPVVAGHTIIGNRRMRPVEHPIIIVDRKGRRHPVGFRRMAALTIGRNTQRRVVGIDTRIVIGLMAAHTGIRRIVVIPIMAGRTIIGNRRVRPINDPIGIVNSKGRRHPVGLGGMTALAIGRNTQCRMIGINTLVEIGLVAAHTGRRGVIVVAIMATGAIIGHR